MNNKLKYLVLLGTLATMLMGAGYAAWTDQIKVDTTVKTGHLDVHFVDQAGDTELKLAPYVSGNVSYAQENDNPGNTKEQNNWDKAKVTFENMYPGAQSEVTLKIANNSTMPVEMRAIRNDFSDNWGERGENFNQIGATLRYFDENGTPLAFAHTSTYANPWEPEHLKNVELPVGGYATLSFTFTAADNIAEDATYTFSPYAVFQQFNDLNTSAQNNEEHRAGIVTSEGETGKPVDGKTDEQPK